MAEKYAGWQWALRSDWTYPVRNAVDGADWAPGEPTDGGAANEVICKILSIPFTIYDSPTIKSF